jgi:hypothetical protein
MPGLIRPLVLASLACLFIAIWCPGLALSAPKIPPVKFDRDIRPILSENCFPCHGADANKRKAKLRLDIPNGTTNVAVVVPGQPDKSDLVARILAKDDDERMPPPDSKRHLSDAQKQLLSAWITDGAKYEKHWAFKSPVKPALPAVKKKAWPHNSIDYFIDYFILARLEAEGMSPSQRAPTERLLRRVSFDLTGLPPTRLQIKTWSKQRDPYAAALDDLLASPRFGERMASDWMDLARYADTHGFNNDSQRTMWRWRDWVIEAFNRNLPYNRFLTEQLAGDLLEPAICWSDLRSTNASLPGSIAITSSIRRAASLTRNIASSTWLTECKPLPWHGWGSPWAVRAATTTNLIRSPKRIITGSSLSLTATPNLAKMAAWGMLRQSCQRRPLRSSRRRQSAAPHYGQPKEK